eukprot:TRINITY_DN31748_c0_g1_i1.p1 TRINITY_DN31748_c0_g1~~TRINITY_DN31748_c0_g1_i1.p1  ORF type:complete len:282 (+),score=37.32 TRINITY_DN31748_c0_g1_i1:67-912(+)
MMEFRDDAALLASLPPLPKPKKCDMRCEAAGGCTTVSLTIATFLAGTHAGVNMMGDAAAKEIRNACLVLIYMEAAIAIFCLLGLMWGDPGVVKRSKQNCLPLPEEVARKLQAGEPLGSQNITDGDRTFCVRCCVWRIHNSEKGGSKAFHHCSICQRCVVHFDHHCGVFGRCIAGDGCGGNMLYFKTIIGMGAAGLATCGITFVAGMFYHAELFWLGILLSCYLGSCLLGIVAMLFCFICERDSPPAARKDYELAEVDEAKVIGSRHSRMEDLDDDDDDEFV